MGALMKSKPTGGESSTTTETKYPEYINAMQKLMYGSALDMLGPNMGSPKYQVAGMTQDQMTAGNLYRQNAQDAFGTDYAGKIEAAGGPVTGNDAIALMNPFLDRVGKSTMEAIRDQYDDQRAMAGARSANGVAFGGAGSGLALERAQLARNEGQQRESAISGLLSAGYDRGASLAENNAQRQLAAAIAANSAAGDTLDRRQTAADAIYGYGTGTQKQAQAALDAPYINLQRLMGIVPGVTGATKQSTPETWNPLSTILGIGGMFL